MHIRNKCGHIWSTRVHVLQKTQQKAAAISKKKEAAEKKKAAAEAKKKQAAEKKKAAAEKVAFVMCRRVVVLLRLETICIHSYMYIYALHM